MFAAFQNPDGAKEPGLIMGVVPAWLCEALGWTIRQKSQEIKPIMARKNTFCKSMNETIPAGHVVGMIEKTTIMTHDWIKITTDFRIKSYDEDDEDYNEIRIKADPDLVFTSKPAASKAVTCTALVNRVLDVINAPPGYITTNNLPAPRYVADLSGLTA